MNYNERVRLYNKAYWGCNNETTLYSQNGFYEYPNDIYSYFTTIINCLVENDECKVLDLGCGNGLLLKHLVYNCSKKIIPYGVDFLEKSIETAKNIVHINYSDNFFLMNINEFIFFKNLYDIIIIDPYLLDQSDFERVSKESLEHVNIAVIFYLYSDVIKGLSINSIEQLRVLEPFDKQIFDYDKVSLAIVKKTI